MIVKVEEHKITIQKTPVNENEVNVSKIQFEFVDTIPSNYVKKAFFKQGNVSKQITLENNECNIPVEVLYQKGQVRLGVIAYEVQDNKLIERFNPSPTYFEVYEGSLVPADNTEPLTPTDKEQMEQAILDVQTQMNNLDIDGEKVDHTATFTITKKDGTTKTVQISDGEQGPQGEPGVPGAVKFLIVNELPTQDIQTDAIYLVPSQSPSTSDLYDEYMYINNTWELLGQKQITVDLTDYVKFTDYATTSKGGVIKANVNGFNIGSTGNPYAEELTYVNYQSYGGGSFVSKGTLENVIAGKGLVSNTDYATYDKGGTIKVDNAYGLYITNGILMGANKSYANYQTAQSNLLISKQTLENVITGKDLTTKSYVDSLVGDINSALDSINGEVI